MEDGVWRRHNQVGHEIFVCVAVCSFLHASSSKFNINLISQRLHLANSNFLCLVEVYSNLILLPIWTLRQRAESELHRVLMVSKAFATKSWVFQRATSESWSRYYYFYDLKGLHAGYAVRFLFQGYLENAGWTLHRTSSFLAWMSVSPRSTFFSLRSALITRRRLLIT